MDAGERLARIETDLANLRAESRALQTTLHELVRTALADHATAIGRLSAAHEQRTGIWWTLLWIGTGLLIVIGGGAWLFEHQIQIIIKS